MDEHQDWLNRTSERIRGLKAVLSEREYKKRKLDRILRVTQRIADFSPTCEECHKYQDDITNFIYEMGSMAPASKQTKNNYRIKIKNITSHLSKKHKLSYKGQHLGFGLSVGIGIGVSIGSAMENIAIGVAIGVAIGLTVGSALEANARKKNKVI